MLDDEYKSNLTHIQNRLKEMGKPHVRIIAVSKTHGPEAIDAMLGLGQRDFGENRQNEARDKLPLVNTSGLDSEHRPIYHHIGPLQSSGARQIPGLFHYVHGVGSRSALEALAKAALKFRDKSLESGTEVAPLQYLIQMNLTGETSKMGGMSLEEWDNLDGFTENDALKAAGFMTMGPTNQDPVQTREVFHHLREFRDKNFPQGELSMGMSGDWEMAVEEGATMIRLGTTLFGKRNDGPWKKTE